MFDLSIFLYTISFTLFFVILIDLARQRYDYLVDGNLKGIKHNVELSSIAQWTNTRIYSLGAISGIFGFLIGFYLRLGGLAFPFLCFIICASIPILIVNYKRRSIRIKMQDQVIQMLNMLASSLRSGKTLTQALLDVGDSIGSPIDSEIKLINRQIIVGIKLESALKMFQKRIDLAEITFAVKAMIISISTGADLPSAMLNVANTITARDRLERKIKTLTAQGRAQALIMGLAPFVLMAIFYVLSPKYYGVMFTSLIGNVILSIIIILQMIAYFTIKQIVKVKL